MRGSFILLAVFLLGTVSCDFTIWSPSALTNEIKKTLPLALANFGHTPYGKSLHGNLVLPSGQHTGCTQLPHLPHDEHQTFVLARATTDCHPVTQALNAERAGAKMLVLIHSQQDETINGVTKEINVTTLDYPDDGMGHLVKIPTIIIESKTGGDIVRFFEKNPNATVSVTAKFNFLNQTNKVKYSLWMSSASVESRNFLKAVHKFHNLLGDRIEFVPKFVVVTCFECQDKEGFTKDHTNCLSGGRYCAPDHGPRGISDGRQVVHEDIRMSCILQQDPSAKSFFKYIEKWDKEADCYQFKGHECSYKVMSEVGIDADKVKQCHQNSFELPQGQSERNHLLHDNSILRASLAEYKRAGLPLIPTVTINGKPYHGNMKPASFVFEAICSAYISPPDICSDYYQIHESHSYTWILIVITVILVFFLVCMVVRYKSSLREEMMRHMESQVSTQVSQYYAMKGEAAKKESS